MCIISTYMYYPILFNFTFLISVFSLLQFFLKDSKLSLEWTFLKKVFFGVLIASVTLFLITDIIAFNDAASYDMRYVGYIIAANFSGVIGSFITGLFVLIYYAFFKDFTASNQLILLLNLVILAWFNLVVYFKWSRFKTWLAFILGMTFFILLGSSLLDLWSLVFLNFILVYLGSNILGSYFILKFVYYTFDELINYRNLKLSHGVDYLTKINNVQMFDLRLNEIIESARLHKKEFSILMFDLDFFKKVNDLYGHDTGDLVLKEFSQILLKNTRPHDIVARKGGEEFVVILDNSLIENSLLIANRIRELVGKFNFAKELNPLSLTVSIGLAQFPSDAKTARDLIKKSDLALYLAKANGRNRVELYHSTSDVNPKIEFNHSGNKLIDDEHEELVQLFSDITANYILNNLSDSLRQKVVNLKTHFEEHCVSEEKEYQDNHIPENLLIKHQKIHEELLLLFDGLLDRLENDDQALDSEYFTVLSTIIVGHIQTDDTDCFPYLNHEK